MFWVSRVECWALFYNTDCCHLRSIFKQIPSVSFFMLNSRIKMNHNIDYLILLHFQLNVLHFTNTIWNHIIIWQRKFSKHDYRLVIILHLRSVWKHSVWDLIKTTFLLPHLKLHKCISWRLKYWWVIVIWYQFDLVKIYTLN